MKMVTFIVALSAICIAWAEGSAVTPIEKTVQMLSDLEAKVIKEGEDAQKVYDEFAEMCEDRSKNIGYEIKTGKATVAELSASIEKDAATIESLTTKVDKLAGDIHTDESDLKAATSIRAKEAADAAAEEKELTEVIDMLRRAIGLLTREAEKGGPSMLQSKSASSITQALGAMVQASVFSSADAERLTAFVQSAQGSADSDEDDSLGAPDAAVYASHSGNIIDTLEGLLAKAEGQLDSARKTETTNKFNFEMLEQSLKDEIKFAEKDKAAAQKGLAETSEAKATAEGELSVTSKDLGEDIKTLEGLHMNCMTGAEDFEAETKSRGEELKALAEAKKVIKAETGGAEAITYGFNQMSLLQLASSRMSSSTDVANFQVARFVRALARKQDSAALAQLASRISSAMSVSATGGDGPFSKVQGLITDMIERLQADADADASHKAYCDKAMKESTEKKEERMAESEKLSVKIDQMSARSAKLKEQAATLQKELSELASAQAKMDEVRQAEHAAYVKNKAEMETGLEGVKLALKVLREYYAKEDKAHAAASGAANGIIGLLEVVESDLTKGLAEMVEVESNAASGYEQETKENEVDNAAKSQDVKYKTKESVGLDKSIAEASSDREGVQGELDAVLKTLETLKEQCVAKAEPYAERKRRREAELAGLKQALEILEGQAVLLQRTAGHSLRGVHKHAVA